MATLTQLVDDVVANKFELRHGGLNIGRHPDNDIQIDDSAVSAHHARLEGTPNEHFPQFSEYYLVDLGSTNGTFVNNIKLSKRHRLRHNDLVRVGWNTFKFVDNEESDLEKTSHMLSTNS
ncbi:FHA domain-containing protein [Permianibacter sp. IMCC34836]|uniref:FHA domain-containing protein n=1 Tax=Permianibacter fluminis TaxID=2738515 RepID=UPI001555DB51|nr:FHA domain-containing protein [Permianibacter fluminis]NQD37174.1 FHA domain-containing protein [Permianibacter fluminis]